LHLNLAKTDVVSSNCLFLAVQLCVFAKVPASSKLNSGTVLGPDTSNVSNIRIISTPLPLDHNVSSNGYELAGSWYVPLKAASSKIRSRI